MNSETAAMKSLFLVRSEHLTHEGTLFGGDLMAEIDTLAYCLLRTTFPGKSFVTRVAEIAFEHPAKLGDVIVFEARTIKEGTTSIHVEVSGAVGEERISVAKVVFVRVDSQGRKMPISA